MFRHYYPQPRFTPDYATSCPYSRGRYTCWIGCRCAKVRNAMASIPRDASMFEVRS